MEPTPDPEGTGLRESKLCVTGRYEGIPVFQPTTGECTTIPTEHRGLCLSRCQFSNCVAVVAQGEDHGTVVNKFGPWILRPNVVSLYDAFQAVKIGELEGHAAPVSCLAALRSGTGLASGSYDKTIKLWSLDPSDDDASSRCVATLSGHRNWVNTLSCGTFGHSLCLASGSNDFTARVWDLETQMMIRDYPHQASVMATLFGREHTDCESSLFTASGHHPIRVWSLNTPRPTRTIRTADSMSYSIVQHPGNSHLLYAGQSGGNVAVWDLRMESEHLHRVSVHGEDSYVRSLVHVPRLDCFASCSAGSSSGIRLWDENLNEREVKGTLMRTSGDNFGILCLE